MVNIDERTNNSNLEDNDNYFKNKKPIMFTKDEFLNSSARKPKKDLGNTESPNENLAERIKKLNVNNLI